MSYSSPSQKQTKIIPPIEQKKIPSVDAVKTIEHYLYNPQKTIFNTKNLNLPSIFKDSTEIWNELSHQSSLQEEGDTTEAFNKTDIGIADKMRKYLPPTTKFINNDTPPQLKTNNQKSKSWFASMCTLLCCGTRNKY